MTKIRKTFVDGTNEQAKELLNFVFSRSRDAEHLFRNGVELIRVRLEVAVGPSARVLAEVEVAGPKARLHVRRPSPVDQETVDEDTTEWLCAAIQGRKVSLAEAIAQLLGLHLVQHITQDNHQEIENPEAVVHHCCGDYLGSGGDLGVILDSPGVQCPRKPDKRPPES